jgi:G3E family GTPase
MQNQVSDKKISQPAEALNKVNVFIITGFLGSGKTTALNGLLKSFDKKNNFIIENEVGQVNIDKSLITGNIEKIFEITNGCLCCNLDADLYDALDQIAQLETKPENLFIETTGIADAGNLSAIFKEDFVMEVFNLKKIICMVDVEVIEDYLSKTPEAARQIVASDIVVLNKAGNVSSSMLEKIQSVINRINPYAHVVITKRGTLDVASLQLPNQGKPIFSLDFSTNKTDSHDINSVFYETEGRFDIPKLEILLRTSLSIYYQDIYRIKGYVFNTKGEVYLLQSAGKTLTIEPADEKIEKSHLVFIGRKLTAEIAKRLLRSALIP